MESTIEVSFEIRCGASSHPVSMTLTLWGTVTMASPCLLLPESARRLAGSTCWQEHAALQRSLQRALYVGEEALYVGEVDLPAFLRGAQAWIRTSETKQYGDVAEAISAFLNRARERRESLAEGVLRGSGYRDFDEAELRTAFAAKSPVVRWAAAFVAGRRKMTTLAPELVRASEDGDFGVQVAAVRALAEIADASAVPVLCRWLGEKEWLIPEIRTVIAQALGAIRDAQAVEPLIRALGDWDERVRDAAAWALGRIGDAQAVKPLIRALGD
ncbi:MAG: HEAT repeat domain-containing protein [Acidobacteriota bacterium]|nr:HEAT repeat domain-containing protein [Acidobacteriota bacterium]